MSTLMGRGLRVRPPHGGRRVAMVGFSVQHRPCPLMISRRADLSAETIEV